jgi:hypothetical protein
MMDDPSDDPIGSHMAKLLDEHLLRNGRESPVPEAQHVAAEEMRGSARRSQGGTQG